MTERLWRGWIKAGVTDQDIDGRDAGEQPRTIDSKLNAAAGVILGVALGALFWALFWAVILWREA